MLGIKGTQEHCLGCKSYSIKSTHFIKLFVETRNDKFTVGSRNPQGALQGLQYVNIQENSYKFALSIKQGSVINSNYLFDLLKEFS